jgi:PAS domain S-box-containing protein
VAHRCWESVERAKAARDLKESDERYRAFIANSSEAIWRFELDHPIPLTLAEDEQFERFFEGTYLAECNDAMARMYGYQSANQILGARISKLVVKSDPQNINYFRSLKRAGGRLTDVETRVVDSHGNAKYFLSNVTLIAENGAYVRFWGTQRDITEVRQAGDALRESEERLRRITDATRDALWEVDLKTNRLWWSEGAKPLFGHSPGELQIGLEDWYSAIHPEDMARVRIKFEKFMRESDSEWFDDYRFRRADGIYVDIHDQGRKFYDDSGMPVKIAGAMGDVTKRKRAEEALRESEERFEKAFKASPDALVISRISDGAIIEVNERFISLSGYSRDDLIGKSTILLNLYADPTTRHHALTILKEQNRVRDLEFPMRRKSGEVRLMTFSAEPFDLRGERCWLTIGRDITENKRAEEARRRSEEEARRQLAYVEAIYATAPVGLCFVDTDLRYRSINERLAEINGKSVEEHIGRTLREIMPEIADRVEPYYRRVIETGEPVLDVELSATVRSGELHHFIVRYSPVKTSEGLVLGVNVVLIEMTQRKQAEEERERLLQQEKSAREEAEAADRMKDEFLATISHELRTPLTSILGWARILNDGVVSEVQTRRALQVIEQSAKSQARLVDDILDTSRIITGRLKLDSQLVDIERVFQAAVDVIRPSAEAKRITLQVVVDHRDGMVLGDANRLQQVIWNLLSNAVKFTNEGGCVEARLTHTDGEIEVSVGDTGIGIEPQFLPYIFDRFRQADSTSTRKYGGLGLGLAIVRHVVEMHGGRVSASSPGLGRGASFRVRFPAALPARPPQPENRTPESESNKPVEGTQPEERQKLDDVRVLVVEDDPDTLDMLGFILDQCGAEVITADSTSEALKVMERWQPDVLISDLAMPDQDGYELIEHVRSRGPDHGGNIPAVALSAYTRAEDRIRALSAGFQMHVPKPVDPEELVAVVASLTGRIQS